MSKVRLKDQLAVAHEHSALMAAMMRIDETIAGSFGFEDALVFSSVLAQQSATGLRGEILEIGTLNGKTAAILALHLQEGETLHVADLFTTVIDGANDAYVQLSTEETVRANILEASGAPAERLVTHAGDSRALDLPADAFRLVHVDGDHRLKGCLADCENAWRWLKQGGVLAVDDIAHPQWPQVSDAVALFAARHADALPLIDYNRRGAQGRKLLFLKTPG